MQNDAREIPSSGHFDTLADYRRAIDRAVLAAKRTIRVFDRSLEDAGFNEASRFEALRSFLLSGRDRRLEVVLHDTEYIQRYCPRMLSLLRQFSHAVHIHQTNSEARGVYDGILVMDDAHFVHRFHFDHARGEWVLNDLARTQPLLRRFEDIWAASTAAVSATTLGL